MKLITALFLLLSLQVSYAKVIYEKEFSQSTNLYSSRILGDLNVIRDMTDELFSRIDVDCHTSKFKTSIEKDPNKEPEDVLDYIFGTDDYNIYTTKVELFCTDERISDFQMGFHTSHGEYEVVSVYVSFSVEGYAEKMNYLGSYSYDTKDGGFSKLESDNYRLKNLGQPQYNP